MVEGPPPVPDPSKKRKKAPAAEEPPKTDLVQRLLASAPRLGHRLTTLPGFRWDKNVFNLSCWLCGEPFEGPVLSYPVRERDGQFEVDGVFCSLACDKRYIIIHYYQDPTILTLFTLMCRLVYNVGPDIVPAPPPQLLKKYLPFSNGLTLKEFRNMSPNGLAMHLVVPPVFPFAFEEMYLCVANTGEKTVEEAGHTHTVVETPPLQKEAATLESYFPVEKTD